MGGFRMCTAITLESMQKENFFGRTMDFSFPIEPGLYVIPQNHQWNSLITTKKYTDKYSFISIGQETDGMLGFFDGVNERGFAAAVLYFEGYADLDRKSTRLNSSHVAISYAVFCLKKKNS